MCPKSGFGKCVKINISFYTHTLFRENFQNGEDFHYKNYFDSYCGEIKF
jgi:hypothetical protein